MAPAPLRPSLRKLLNCISTTEKLTTACECGSPMEYHDTIVSYKGQSWRVALPVCLSCHPIPLVPTHAA
jgi:hypothetical protein